MRTLFLFVFIFVVFSSPQLLLSAGLVPCGTPGDPCQACHLAQLVNNVIKFLTGIFSVIIATVIVVAGLKMAVAQGNEGAISDAKKMIKNSIIGFVIFLAAWLIVDTVVKLLINPNIIGPGTKYGPWNQIQCVLPQPETVPTQPGSLLPSTPTQPSVGQLSHNDALQQLADAGIAVTASRGIVQADCSSVTGCTSLNNIREATIQDAIKVKNECNCEVVITGATEGMVHATGELSHANGYKYDMRLNETLNSYITTNFRYVGQRSGDNAPMYIRMNPDNTRTVYALEGDHWDVQVRPN